MKVVNLLDFLNSINKIYALEYSECANSLVNFLDLLPLDEQFMQRIDFGMLFIHHKTSDSCEVVDGIGRIISLSLLLHAICECYKKTTERNEKAIRTIRNKYLLSGETAKLHLPEEYQNIYNKIIFGERLSGKEKNSPIFKLLHSFWTQIKEEELQASLIFNLLNRIFITQVDTGSVPPRDLYYSLNKNKRCINQIALIDNYMKSIGVEKDWENVKKIYNYNEFDINLFFKDFFITKFSYRKYDENKLYENFVNYFETMLMYLPEDILLQKLCKTAKLYHNMLNVNFNSDFIKKAFIQIKMHNGEDTYAYLLNIYEDYVDNNISETTFIEILSTIDEYLRKRLKTPNNVSFNELIQYLNAFITCK